MRHNTATLKKAAQDGFAATIGRLTRSPNRLRAITFHDISEHLGDPYGLSAGQFADFLRVVKDEGYRTICPRELAADWPSKLARRFLLMTFDDGYASHSNVVVDLLLKHGLTGSFFVLSSHVAAQTKRRVFSQQPRAFLDGEDLRQMDAAGMEVGSHSHSHVRCGSVPLDQARCEISLSKQLLQEHLGHSISSFAYPYGRRNAYSAATRTELQAAGYSVAFTQTGVRITSGSDLLELPRINIDRTDSVATFTRKLYGQYEPLNGLRSYGR